MVGAGPLQWRCNAVANRHFRCRDAKMHLQIDGQAVLFQSRISTIACSDGMENNERIIHPGGFV